MDIYQSADRRLQHDYTHPGEASRASWLAEHWFAIFILAMGLFVGLPFLAPVFMKFGWTGPGRLIYSIYSLLCHQLPQRSFFLFGSKAMYSLGEIQSVWQESANPMILRQFIGNSDMGWKVAWSDRMVSMYTGTLFAALLWWPIRKQLRPLPWWGLAIFLFPMFIDGSTHFISDFWGLGEGFRYSNAWLAELTGDALSPSFYAGDALGSFNSWMRLITGVLFGTGVVWFGFQYLEDWGLIASSRQVFSPGGTRNGG